MIPEREDLLRVFTHTQIQRNQKVPEQSLAYSAKPINGTTTMS